MDPDAYLWQSLKRLWRAPCAMLVLGLAFLGCAPAQAQRVTNSGSASAVVVAPLALTSNQALNFGRVAAGSAAGTVELNPDTLSCTLTGPIVRIGSCRPAEFTGMGVSGMIVRITLPSTITLNRNGGGATMKINAITLGAMPDLVRYRTSLRRWVIQPTNGIFDFRVGGTLMVGANQLTGVYSGNLDVTVQYQ
ncbi:MAG: DUF4402 domain-containing protein [Novosphingobium sp.]